jgi:hypothetical protein
MFLTKLCLLQDEIPKSNSCSVATMAFAAHPDLSNTGKLITLTKSKRRRRSSAMRRNHSELGTTSTSTSSVFGGGSSNAGVFTMPVRAASSASAALQHKQHGRHMNLYSDAARSGSHDGYREDSAATGAGTLAAKQSFPASEHEQLVIFF